MNETTESKTKVMTIDQVETWKTKHNERTTSWKSLFQALKEKRAYIDQYISNPIAPHPDYFDFTFSCLTKELDELKPSVMKMTTNEDFIDYKILRNEFYNFATYVKALHLAAILLPEEEYLYRGYWARCTFDTPEEPEDDNEKWKKEMGMIFNKWNYLNAAFSITHGYPDRIFYSIKSVYDPMLICADDAYNKLYDLPVTDDTLPLYTWAISIINRLDANNTKLHMAALNDEMFVHDIKDLKEEVKYFPGEEYSYHVISF